MATQSITDRLDAEVERFVQDCIIFPEDAWTPNRCRAWVLQHRLNSRQRNSVLKLKVATNCPIWDIKLDIIHACSQEIIADDEFGALQAVHRAGIEAARKVEDQGMRELAGSPENVEAIAAFMQKRVPDFKQFRKKT